MQVETEAIIVNELGHLLMVRDHEKRRWRLPGGSLPPGVSAPDGLSELVAAETGLKILPVRLVGLYYRPAPERESLILVFRCLPRSGGLQAGAGIDQLGYLSPAARPATTDAALARRLMHGLRQTSPLARWETQNTAWFGRLTGRLSRRNRVSSPESVAWQTGTTVILGNAVGEILWVQTPGTDPWRLPGGPTPAGEPPWVTARRIAHEVTGRAIEPQKLVGIYVRPPATMILSFFAANPEHRPATESAAVAFHLALPGQEPADALPGHREQVADFTPENQPARFRLQPDP